MYTAKKGKAESNELLLLYIQPSSHPSASKDPNLQQFTSLQLSCRRNVAYDREELYFKADASY